ncbi:MAG: hypothetical protein DRP13_01025 [Candidatus Aenigmatarchaeota archaeon]|nr:MAG: hypothetical protein DRP13_01025 [Candidatus Aenigmarchaeota archaeon]
MITICFRKGGHPAYNEIFNYPPSGVKYKEIKFLKGAEGVNPPFLHKLKRKAHKIYKKLIGDVNLIPISCKEDIIYSCGGLMASSSKPWVTDAEHVSSLINIEASRKTKLKTITHIKKSNCKILPWSNASLESIKNFFGKEFYSIKNKFEVVYPAMHIEKLKKKKQSSEKIKFLYINRVFWGKCGYEVLEAFNRLAKKYDTELIFVSNTPKHIEKKFRNVNIKFIHTPIPRRRVLELYKDADVFVLPTLFDTFGFVYLEAMSYGLPIIATNVFAVPEIIQENFNGLLVTPEYSLFSRNLLFKFSTQKLYEYAKTHPQKKLINQLEDKMKILIENTKERKTYGKRGRDLVEKGKFSISYRNKQLKRIYEELLKHTQPIPS